MSEPAPRSSASIRRRIVTATALISVTGIAVLIGAVVIVASGTTDREMDQVLDARVAAVRAITEVSDGRISVRDRDDTLYGTLTWVANPQGVIEAGPKVPADLRDVVAQLAGKYSVGEFGYGEDGFG